MTKPLHILRKIAVVTISIPIFILGIILIPLPGPGLLVSLLALVILSFEFEWAKKYRDRILGKLKAIIAEAKSRSENINKD